jgi:hypothetical protein
LPSDTKPDLKLMFLTATRGFRMREKSEDQIEFDLLLKYGYRPDRLMPNANGNGFHCSLADLPAVTALVQNPQSGLVAERVGFEPTVRFPAHTLSKRAP